MIATDHPEDALVLRRDEAGVATLTLNRPRQYNALSQAMLGALQVDARGLLANWMVPGKIVPGMGGAMDLVSGAKKVVVAMIHTARGTPKIVETCDYPLTAIRPVDLIVTDLAVIAVTPQGLKLQERAPGVTVAEIQAATGTPLIVEGEVPEMAL